MKITISLNGVKVHREIPISWDTVTYSQFLQLTDCVNDPVKILTVFTGIEEAVIKKATILGLDSIIAVLGFLRTEPPQLLPKTILGYQLPPDVGLETLDQYTDLKDDLDKAGELKGKDALEKYPLYCAIYACKAKHGRYDWTLAEQMAPEFLNAPAPEVLAIGNFTLAKLIGLNLNIDPASRKKITRLKKFKLVLKAWLTNTRIMAHSRLWRRKTIPQ
jgi:hypothetical protein